MKNTDYNIRILSSMVASESSFNALLEIIDDLDLEITSVNQF